jgi:hypothetical protein
MNPIRAYIKAADFDEMHEFFRSLPESSFAWATMPDGGHVFCIESPEGGANTRRRIMQHAKALELPAAHDVVGTEQAARFAHIKATDGMSAKEFYKKLYARSGHPILDPNL